MQKTLISFLFFINLSACSSIGDAMPSEQKVILADERNIQYSCPYALTNVYKENLVIESKYDQSDKTKSKLKSKPDKDSYRKKSLIDAYSKLLVKYSDYAVYEKNLKKRKMALACFQRELDNWALNNALLSVEASKTGQAVKKWLLASISSSIIKIKYKYPQYELSSEASSWLNALVEEVQFYYQPRINNPNIIFNNHDYWAAWSVLSTSIVLGDDKMKAWPKQVFDFAINQIQKDEFDNHFLKNEINRGKLAANYSNYALIPLMFMADVFFANKDVSINELDKLKKLAFTTFSLSISPEEIEFLTDIQQEKVSKGKFIWILPYENIYGSDDLVKRVKNNDKYAQSYSQSGGNLRVIYEGVE